MADEVNNNIFLINAPAGSGKTTTIRNRLQEITQSEPLAKVLCITYTNRAAEELQKGLDNKNIFVSTIHSYINSLISPFFSDKNVVDLYFLLFNEKIKARIANSENDEHIKESNQKYVEKYGDLSEEIIKQNLVKLHYNEMQFTSLYYGGLSHDDLLSFAFNVSEKYTAILKKISGKFNYIFIDEYQDTSANVLKVFFNAVKGKDIKLFLLGDRMQQIYKNYDGSLEDEFRKFNTEQKLRVNHRSVSVIINILNKLYNDKEFDQEPSEKNKAIIPDYQPELIVAPNVNDAIKFCQSKYKKPLVLYLLNRDKYIEIGAENFYRCFDGMEKYSFGSKNSTNDVLSDLSDDNPDLLMKFLFLIYKISELYSAGNYGTMISICKKQNKFFNKSFVQLNKHTDKTILKQSFDKLIEVYKDDNSTVKMLFDMLIECNISTGEIVERVIEPTEYSDVMEIKIKELKNLAKYLNAPAISTQHGVKGESYESVIFVANDSSNPNVRMYDFFKLWASPSVDLSLTKIESIYYDYVDEVRVLEKKLCMKTDDLNAANHNKNEANKTILITASEKMIDKFLNNEIFKLICKKDYETYLSNPNVGNAKKTFKTSKLYGIISAYRLFYVGCSRARKNLSIIVDASKIDSFREYFIKKAVSIGATLNDKQS